MIEQCASVFVRQVNKESDAKFATAKTLACAIVRSVGDAYVRSTAIGRFGRIITLTQYPQTCARSAICGEGIQFMEIGQLTLTLPIAGSVCANVVGLLETPRGEHSSHNPLMGLSALCQPVLLVHLRVTGLS